MPVAFEGPPDELSGLAMFLEEQRAGLLRNLDGLTDEQATSHPTASSFCMLTLVKHVAFVERRWFQLEVARRQIEGLWPPPDDREMEIEPGDSVESVRAFYEQITAENREILAGVDDLDSLSEIGLNRRWILLHLIEEIARHAGHADLIRESIDGRTWS
jgi:uncharacterized damage-inducible protein DinB